MSALIRRFVIALGVSVLVGVAFVPLGWTGWAEGIRSTRGEARDVGSRGEGPGGETPGQAHFSAMRLVAPFVKVTVLMGVPAVLIVVLAIRPRRRPRSARP